MIAIRCDANAQIAMGHLMRCMAIAGQVRQLGEEVLFLLSEEAGIPLLQEKGFRYICLQNEYVQKEEELSQLLDICRKEAVSCLLIDSYEVTKYYFLQLGKELPLAYIDDMQGGEYPVDLLINYSVNAQEARYVACEGNRPCVQLLGSLYTPIRQEFLECATAGIHSVETMPESIFMTCGGTDPYGILVKMLHRFQQAESIRQMKKYVVAGKFYQDMMGLQRCQQQYGNIEIFQNVSEIWDIMKQGDIAITAGGTTVAELCSMKKPIIAFAMADNQLGGLAGYEKKGALLYVGDIRNNEERALENMVQAVQCYREDVGCRRQKADCAAQVVDGKGARRIATALQELGNQR